jgi:ribosomal protein L29
MAKKSEYFKPRTQKQIQNLSRAINKIDPELGKRVMGVQYSIRDVKMGINDFQYQVNGQVKKVRYDQIESLPRSEQASLLNQLSYDRYQLRQQRALEQIKEKGKISEQFKRSIAQQNKKLLENIETFEDLFEGNTANMIAEEFSEAEIITGEDWFDEADSYFQLTSKDGKKRTPELFDFYKPGEANGFTELNAFTWNTYKVMKGI